MPPKELDSTRRNAKVSAPVLLGRNTMENAYSAAKLLQERWQTLRTNRPVADLQALGYSGVSLEDFDELFKQWEENFKQLTAKTKVYNKAESAIVESKVAKLLLDSTNQISAALTNNNDIGWLLGSGFYQWITEASVIVSAICERHINFRKEFIKLAESKTNRILTEIETAAPIAKKIMETHQRIADESFQIENAKKSVQQEINTIESLKNNAVTDQTIIAEYLSDIGKKKAELDGVITSLQSSDTQA